MPSKNINQELSKFRSLVKNQAPIQNKLKNQKSRYNANLKRDKKLLKMKNNSEKKQENLIKKITKNQLNISNTNKELRKIYSKINYNNKKIRNLNNIKNQMFSDNIIVDLENETYTINGITYNFNYDDRLILLKLILIDLGKNLKNVNIIMSDGVGEFFNNNYNLEGDLYNEAFNNFRDFRDGSGPTIFDRELRNGLIEIQINTLLKITSGNRITQYFLDGEKIHCFFNPILNYFNKLKKNNVSKSSLKVYSSIVNKTIKYIKEYKDGIMEEDIYKICNDLKISVRLYKPYNQKDTFFQFNHQKSSKIFNYINTRKNHLEILHNDNEIIKIETIDEMMHIKNVLEENSEYYIYKRNRFGINKIITIKNTYNLKLKHMEEIIDFQEKIGINRFNINYQQNKKLSNYIFKGTLLTNSINFKLNPTDETEYKHIDQYRSYMQFKKCGYYQGFPSIFTDFVRLDKTKIEDKKLFLSNKIGFFNIKNINIENCEDNTKKILETLISKDYLNTSYNYTNVELLYLIDLGINFNLISGMYCRKSFDMKDEDLKLIDKKVSIDNENEVGLYSIFSGMLSSVKFNTNYYFRTDEEFASHLKVNENKFDLEYNNSNQTGIFSVKNENINHKAHIGAFIYSYQRINLFNQLFKLKYENIIRVVMDGIFYKGETPELFNLFREKPADLMNDECNFINILSAYKWSENIDIQELQHFNKNDDGRLIALTGAGGNGKSYNSITKNKNLNILYIAPSYTLARSKKEEFTYINEDVYANVLEGRKWKLNHKDYSIIIVDEITMITENMKRKFIKMFNYSKIYFCGDLEKQENKPAVSYQLPPICEKVMNLDNLDIIYEYKKNYRFDCDKLKKIIWFLRKQIKKGINPEKVLKQFENMMEKENRVINMEELEKLYKIEDMILTSRKQCRNHDGNCDCSTNHIKIFNEKFDYEKYLITSNTMENSNGDIILNPIKILKNMERRNSFTIHQIQGKTIKDNKVFIYSKNFFDITMLYVAVSRVVKLDQIFLIV